MNTWTSAGPEGGPILALAVDPKTSGVAYAGGLANGFKTSAGGNFWSQMTGRTGGIRALAIDPLTPTIVYAGLAAVLGAAGLDKSTDGGATWIRQSLQAPITALAIDPKVPTTVYAGSFSGAFKTTDGGLSWSALPLGNHEVKGIAIDAQSSATVYALTIDAGLFKSTNGGASWSPRNLGLEQANFLYSLAVDPIASGVLYVGGDRGVFKSTNGAGNWTRMSSGLPERTVRAVTVSPQEPATLYVGTTLDVGGVFKSTDGGATWKPTGPGLPVNPAFQAKIVNVVVVDPRTPATVYAGADLGVFKSTDGGASWMAKNSGLTAEVSTVVAVDPSSPSTVFGGGGGRGMGEGGLFKSTNGGATNWIRSDNGLELGGRVSALAADRSASGVVYAGTSDASNDGVFKSTNGGMSWNRAGVGLPNADCFSALALDARISVPTTLYVGTCRQGIFRSTDAGQTWNARSDGLAGGAFTQVVVESLAIDPQNPNTLYAGTDGAGVFKSTNGGLGWTASNSGLGNLLVQSLAIDPQVPAVVHAGTRAGPFKSLNGGASWSASAGLGNVSVRALAINPQNPATIYAGTESSGVYRSTDGGASWSAFNAGLASRPVFALAVTPSGSCVHAATDGGLFVLATQASVDCPSPPTLAAVLSTTSQSVQVGTPARTVATVQNLSTESAVGVSRVVKGVDGVTCGITQLTGAPTPFTFQAVDPTTGQSIAPVNTPVDINAGSLQKFLITLTPTASLCALNIKFSYNCTNTGLADIITGQNTFQLTAGSPAGCGLSTAVTASQASFVIGQTLVAGGSVTNPGLPGVAADFYVGVLRPDNSIQFFTSTGIVLGNLADLRSFRALATNVPLATPFSVNQSTFFTRLWTAADQRGSYVFFLAALKAGALSGGSVTNDQILGVATAPYALP